MPADGVAFLDDDTAARTRLARERGIDRSHPTPGRCCRGGEDGEVARPPGIGDAPGEAAMPHQVGDPHVFVIDRVVVAHQGERRLVMKVLALLAKA